MTEKPSVVFPTPGRPQQVSALVSLAPDRPLSGYDDRVDTVDARMLGLMRCVLAFSALAIVWIDPSGPQRLVNLTYTSLLLYCAYSTFLGWRTYLAGWPMPPRSAHWIDIAFYAWLVALTEGTGSIFFHFFFFAILSASFSKGFREGISVTAASLLLFMSIGFVSEPAGGEFELNRTLIRAVYLSVLGYMIAYWGGHEMLLKRRLKLLQEINNFDYPRFGTDYAIESNLNRLLEFCGGESCVLVLKTKGPPEHFRLYRTSAGRQRRPAARTEITQSTAEPLLRLPESIAAAYCSPNVVWWRRFGRYYAYDFSLNARTGAYRDECTEISQLLETEIFITVPYTQSEEMTGRLYLSLPQSTFLQSDVHFLVQASHAMATVIENMHLVEELISRASEFERLKISRDLHDTTIQPYIGLKLALDALQREAGTESKLARRISELVEMTNMTIRDLRNYAASLKDEPSMTGEFLVSAIKKQAERLGRFYEVNVDVTADISAEVSGGTAAQAFQIVSEGLSNILRHTQAKKAFVDLRCQSSDLSLSIGNETNGNIINVADFTPRSICERVRFLGGTTLVDQASSGFTVVRVTIPARAA